MITEAPRVPLYSRRSSPSTAASLRSQVIRLAVGATAHRDWGRVDWHRLLEHATRERCAPLSWLRSRRVIREFAPATVAAQWRAQALAAGELAAAQAEELVALVEMLVSAGAPPVVLKGLPLSALLYQDISARPVFDIDLFVPVESRGIADRCLRSNNWSHLDGISPAEGTYRLNGPARAPHLEIHSSLFDDALLSHIARPPVDSARVEIAGHRVPAQTGEWLPVFLAVHLSKHAAVPLLWWIDFATCWDQLDRAQRARARTAAATFGLERFISWAERGVADLTAICNEPEEEALDRLARLDALHRDRNALRVARLVDGFGSRIRVVLGWMLPAQHRSSPRALANATIRRIKARFGKVNGRPDPAPARVGAVADAVRPIVTDPATLASIVRETTLSGRGVWIRARGTSMLPTIPRMADVLIGPVPPTGLERGDVVLVDRPGSHLLMHRVLATNGDFLSLKGDNRFEVDLPVHRGAVIGRAFAFRVDGHVQTVPQRRPRSLRFALARWRTSAWKHVSST